MITRTFEDYDFYVYRQGAKARRGHDFLLAHIDKKIEWFTREFKRATWALKRGAVLCLGARTGAENIGAIQAGFKYSVGVDLHPVGPTVLKGDWHDLQFQDSSFANVYCNSLDHCLFLDRFCEEVRRVLEPDGRLYVAATNRSGKTAEEWLRLKGMEALFWDASDDLRDAICIHGFRVTAEWRHKKWGHYVFEVKA